MDDFENNIQKYWQKVQTFYDTLTSEDGLMPKVDYYVFQTNYSFRPKLMIIGVNPGSDGKNHGGWLTQGCNSYTNIQHPWFETLRVIFNYPNNEYLSSILENCVGTNKYFVNTGSADKLPKDIDREVTNLIRELIGIVQPQCILTLGRDVFNAVKNKPLESKNFGSIKLEYSHRYEVPVCYIPNPSKRNANFFSPIQIEGWKEAMTWFLSNK